VTVRHVCGGSEGCMCFYDPKLNDELVAHKMVRLDEVIAALEDYFSPQAHRVMHPADFLTKKYEEPGHEGLEYA
jgi:hypothetical protein